MLRAARMVWWAVGVIRAYARRTNTRLGEVARQVVTDLTLLPDLA